MQDLGRYTKREYVTIKTRYLSFLAAGSVLTVGLVFALGILVGSGDRSDPVCKPKEDPLAALDRRSNEPAPPLSAPDLSFHKSLRSAPEPVPTPASLLSARGADETAPSESLKQAVEQAAEIKPVFEETPIPEKVEQGEPGYYSLQVGSFQRRAEAARMVRMLERAGHKAYLVSVNMPDRGGLWFRVRVGPFLSREDAWKYKKEFEVAENIPAFVVKRRTNG